jgi:hypothetical protein
VPEQEDDAQQDELLHRRLSEHGHGSTLSVGCPDDREGVAVAHWLADGLGLWGLGEELLFLYRAEA